MKGTTDQIEGVGIRENYRDYINSVWKERGGEKAVWAYAV